MSESIYLRLSHILDDLTRLTPQIEPPAMQMALDALLHRLDDLIEETIGLEPPPQEED